MGGELGGEVGGELGGELGGEVGGEVGGTIITIIERQIALIVQQLSITDNRRTNKQQQQICWEMKPY